MKLLFFITLCAVLLSSTEAKKGKDKKKVTDEPNACEVCVETLGLLKEQLGKDASKQPKVEKAITKFCKNKKLNSKQKKMCYYFEPIKKLVSRPFAIGMPALKVCQKLKSNNPEICEVKYPPKIDLATVNFKKMRVKQLKGILADEGIGCDGCTEKEDYVKKVKKLAKKQAAAEEKKKEL